MYAKYSEYRVNVKNSGVISVLSFDDAMSSESECDGGDSSLTSGIGSQYTASDIVVSKSKVPSKKKVYPKSKLTKGMQ